MKIETLRTILNKIEIGYINKISIEIILSNGKKEKKELINFNDLSLFDYRCINELDVYSWDKIENMLIVRVFSHNYLKALEKFVERKI